ncbi:MAG TPA: tyrosine-type recombinase/integrase [Chloroflexota bacterium]|nr:tyrosine-type recombinase/integrase [Chloroflexota bacterium]
MNTLLVPVLAPSERALPVAQPTRELAALDPFAARFWSHVERTPRCWLWTNKLDVQGRGYFYVGAGVVDLATRVAWRLAYGPIAPGLIVRQSCATAACVNPKHLLLAPPPDSFADRAGQTHSTFWNDCQEWLEGLKDLNRSPKTISTYRLSMGRFELWRQKCAPDVACVSDLKGRHARDYGRYLRNDVTGRNGPLSETTRAKELEVLRSLLKWTSLYTDLDVMSRDRVPVPATHLGAIRNWARPEDVGALVGDLAGDTVRGRRDRAIVGLLFLTGLRISELLGLDREQFPLARLGKEVTFSFNVVGKGSKVRICYLSLPGQDLLRATLSDRRDDWPAVFLGTHPGQQADPRAEPRLTARSVQTMLRRSCTALGIQLLSPHSFRHGYATAVLGATGDLSLTQLLMGHSSPQTTARYAHVVNARLREGYATAFGEMLKTEPTGAPVEKPSGSAPHRGTRRPAGAGPVPGGHSGGDVGAPGASRRAS